MKADPAKLADKILRTPKCSRCRNHGFLVPVKGHAGKCHWKQCTCDKCYLITERQKIMAAQKVLKKQGLEEEQELAQAQAPGPAPRGPELAVATGVGAAAAATSQGSSFCPLPPLPAAAGPAPGPDGRAAVYLCERPPRGPSPGPSAFQPVLGGRSQMAAHLGLEAPDLRDLGGLGGPGHQELCRPLLPPPSPPFANFGLALNINMDRPVGPEYLEREPGKLYPGCSVGMHPFRPFPLGYQDAAPTPGLPVQAGFRHVSCTQYPGGGLVSEPVGDFQPTFYPLPPVQPPQPPYLPPGFLSALHLLPPPPPPPPSPSFSLTILSDTDRENPDELEAETLEKAETLGEAQTPEEPQILEEHREVECKEYSN
ncbi:doublesex- and mab-3-related transcription factor B1 [Ochotona princeps]|uniref:doublesex- and mab-3-related transcription factor B1 n=1 Tax=Ochotona princeps TaxID=9978 RepID=UPI0027149B9C|nr:doublesex- and mab-3-related transcription factor B1 [Ochotona princeps]